jgi:mono/diheme cytochrome c family protein
MSCSNAPASRKKARRALWLLALVVPGCFADFDPNATSAETGGAPATGGARSTGGAPIAEPAGGRAGSEEPSDGGTAGTPVSEPDAGAAGAPLVPPDGRCVPATASSLYAARSVVISGEARPKEEEIFVSAIFNEFSAQCGRCHVLGASGGLSLNSNTFPSIDGHKLLARIKDLSMPPDRPQDEGTAHLVATLEQWIAAGSPKDVLRIPLPPSLTDPYVLTPEVGANLTNIGNCVPEATFPFAWEKAKMRELDAMFEKLGPLQTDLPKALSETDLNSLDSEVLARYGVIAFAPAYPLWSDGSGKIRYVRVPQGQSIQFDKKTQQFTIPPNTRFYKTFLKHIVDTDGKERYRKIETRLIVTRPDTGIGLAAGHALFGSYKWNSTETEATLQNAVDQPLHNGEAFADELVTYISDEPAARAIRDTNPQNLTFEYERAKVIRHYAIPGRDRCMQCHMGSQSADYVLGFTPLQLMRRHLDEGGVFEPAEKDELTQLERLSALGVLRGIDSLQDIVPLELSQGTRTPRNARELTAQGYMLGNCAHCHNPRGYPTAVAPELKVLNFYPGVKDSEGPRLGGIFRFPLDVMSPRVTRGLEARPIPYITPSLRDLIPYNWESVAGNGYTPKWQYDAMKGASGFLDAPWRSLIFRNVHNPFAYGDDFTIFPHMPMNTAGYDCRARQFIGDWMVSIPARRKHQEIKEDYVPPANSTGNGGDARTADNESQPYIEVTPGEDGYTEAEDAAVARLAKFHAGPEYECPDSSDIVDPAVGKERDQGALVITPRDLLAPYDGVPDRAHWVSTDLTSPDVEWEPRQTTWERVLVHQDYPPVEAGNTVKLEQREAEKKVVGLLANASLSDSFKKFALAPFPLALWKNKGAECQAKLAGSSVPKAASFSGTQRPRWLDISKVAADAPVYDTLPGGAIYDMVCVNCHGRSFDAQGRQAETVQLMTGGEARVANFMTGLFGPVTSPGANRGRVFGKVATAGLSVDDWGARYMAWMALGGTDKTIPQAVLQIVSRTDVAGTRRAQALLLDASANMLAAGVAACGFALPLRDTGVDAAVGSANRYALTAGSTPLIASNGDAELWQRVCSLDNRPVVRAYAVADGVWRTGSAANLYKADKYPPGAAIGDHLGKTVKWVESAENYFPWCIKPPFTQPAPPEPQLPVCPDAVLATDAYATEELEDWARRGAVNAGMAVFLYIDQVARGKFDPRRYDECEKLPNP